MRQRSGGWRPIGLALAIYLGLAGVLAAGEKVARWEQGSGLSEPKVVEKTPPVYPEEARKEKVQGAVILEATVTAKGETRDLATVQDPDARLTAAAREAVARWRFEPARDGEGRAVAVRYQVTVNFKLQ